MHNIFKVQKLPAIFTTYRLTKITQCLAVQRHMKCSKAPHCKNYINQTHFSLTGSEGDKKQTFQNSTQTLLKKKKQTKPYPQHKCRGKKTDTINGKLVENEAAE